MTDFSSPAVGFDLNNTWVFGEQDKGGTRRAGSRRRSLLLGACAISVALAGAGCHGRKDKAAKGSSAKLERAGAGSEAGPPPAAPSPPRLEAATLPEPGAAPPRGAANPGARPGGVLRVHLDSEPPHLNPLADPETAISRVAFGLIYQTLIECTPTGYAPGLAERWDVSPDGLRIALHLRPGVRWHDHHLFNVLDVQSTLERVLRSSSNLPLLRADLADVTSVELAADHVVRLNLRRPSDLALRALCDVPILPDHLSRAGTAEASALAKQPVGTGPFRFLGWERGRRIRLGRFREGWGPASPLDEIVFDLEPDGVRALNRTRRGDIDILPRVLDAHYPEQVEPATLHGTVALYRLTPERYSFLLVNHRRFPLGDPQFRHALSALWDRARFAHELHKDLVRPVAGPTFGAGDGAGAPEPRFDRKQAIRSLEDAGYRDNDADGVRDRGGRPIRITLLATAGSRTLASEAHAFTLELRKAGVLLDVVPADPATIMARLKKGDFDLAPMVWEGRSDDDPTPLFGADGAFNFGGYRSAVLDGLLDELRRSGGPTARRPVLGRIARLLADEQPALFLYRHDVPALISNRVHELAAAGDRLDLRQVWVTP